MALWAILATFAIFLFGLAILVLASSYLVTALIKFAKIVGIPTVIVGALILGLGTSLPELSNSLIATAKGLADLGVGNLIGAAVTDLTLAMGLIFLFSKKAKVKEATSRTLLFFILAAAVMFLAFGMDNLIARWEGALMFVVFLVYQVIIFKEGFSSLHERFSARKLVIPYLLIPLALFSVLMGAFLVVETGSTLATLAGISVAVIGLTVVSVGTTLPEIIEGIIAARKGEQNLATGCVLGGAVINILLIFSLAAMIFSLPINYSAFILPAIILAAVILYHLGYAAIRKQTDKVLGASLVGIYLVYLLVNFL